MTKRIKLLEQRFQKMSEDYEEMLDQICDQNRHIDNITNQLIVIAKGMIDAQKENVILSGKIIDLTQNKYVSGKVVCRRIEWGHDGDE